MTFNNFNLDPKLLFNLKTLNYIEPTPIQIQSIPPILLGKDMMGLAQTGTGKTAAFLLPILQKLIHEPKRMHGKGDKIRALLIAPTRELAQQIDDSIKMLGKGTGLKSMTLYGGVKMNPQIKTLKQGIDIIVACPGRLLDHIQQRTVDLSHVNILVLDEADQMFDMGFLPNIKKILKHLPKQRQTLLFSATMPNAVHELAINILSQPVKIKIGSSHPPQSVQQILYPVSEHRKSELLIHLLQHTKTQSVLVFTRTKHTAKKLASKIEKAGFRAASLQGNLSQKQRQNAMHGFRNGALQILVATDIASRGIDVMRVSHVINYDMPSTIESYIHRIGRTGRATHSGDAYTFISKHDQTEVRAIERVLGCKLEQRKVENFDY